MTVFELLAATTILSLVLVVSLQMLAQTAVQQRAVANRRAALQMASNVMERIYTVPWAELDTSAAKPVAAEVKAEGMLRGARIAVAVDEVDSEFDVKRIRVTVGWLEGNDGVERTQQLTAWRYALQGKP